MKYLLNKVKWKYRYYKYMYLVNNGILRLKDIPYEYKTYDMYMVSIESK